MKSWLTALWWFVNDRLYPRLRRFSTQESEREQTLAQTEQEQHLSQIAALPDNDQILAGYLDGCRMLLEEEEATRQGVEARLTSIIGLSSIAGTIVFGGILVLAAGTTRTEPISFRVVMTIGALYLVCQLCWAILASIRGLERCGYLAPNASGVLPLPDEAHPVYLRRQISLCAERLADHRLQRNRKVDQMALAHCAARNFLGGLVLFAVLGTCFSLTAKNPSDDLVHTLRNNRELYELLRGPQGPRGDSGPPGPPKQNLGKQPLDQTKER